MSLRAELLEALRKALGEGSVDSSRVLALSTELAKNDPDRVRFFADAGLIRRLGYELVSRQETAVSEIVKNAYDADATVVDLMFINADEPGGTLEVRDNGVGMTKEELLEGFMRLSSTMKDRNPTSTRYQRRRAGRKGIGRFAVHRLGTRLTLVTQTKKSDQAIRVFIDWNNFEPGLELSSITSQVEKVAKDQTEGTTVRIENLRDPWTEAQMRRIWRYVSDLIQPFPLSAGKIDSLRQDPGFRADVYRQEGGELFPVADEQTQIYEHAVAEIDGEVDSSGCGKCSIKSRLFPQIDNAPVPIGSDEENPSEPKPFKHLQNVRLKAYYFIYQAGLMPRTMDNTIRRIADRRGGIHLYRNGFRVLPYGENRDDWLELDKVSGRRQVLPPIANLNFFGFVEVTDPTGARFEETASREGLIENDSYRELARFIFRVLRLAVFRVAEQRSRKRTASSRESQIESPPEEKVQKAIRELRQAIRELSQPSEAGEPEDTANGTSAASRLVATIEYLEDGLGALQRKQDEFLDELGMLRVLASLGIVIGEFTHEIRNTLTAALLHASSLMHEAQMPALARETATKLESNIDRINSYARYFDRAVRENAQRELAPKELGEAVLDFVRAMKPSAERRDVEIEATVQGYDLYTCSMHGSELGSLLFNFYSNALKAIGRTKKSPGRILIRCGQEGKMLFLEFADDGDGVPDGLHERIFNAFFTTSTSGNMLDDDLQGSGIGLKIVRDVATGYGGDVFLVDPPGGYVTCFRVELPASGEEELADFEL